MNLQTLALILVAVTMSAAAQIFFKFGLTSAAHSNSGSARSAELISALMTPGVLVGLVLYGLGMLVWLAALSRVEVSQAYPFVGLGFVLTAIFGYLFLGDQISPQRIAGIFLIIVGTIAIARS